MSTDTNGAPAGGAPEGTVPPVVPGAADPAKPIGITSEQLTQRLTETRATERREFLKKHGFDSEAAFERQMKASKEADAAKLTEQERITKELGELKPRAERASALEKRLETMVDAQLAALPEETRAKIASRLEGKSIEDRIELLELARELGGAPAAPTGPKTATAGATPPAPKGAPVRTKFDEYQDLKKTRPALASAFYDANRIEIQRTTPGA